MKELIAFRKKYQPFMSFGEVNWLVFPEANEIIGFSYTLKDERFTFYFNESEEMIKITNHRGKSVLFSKRVEIEDEHIKIEQLGFVVIEQLIAI